MLRIASLAVAAVFITGGPASAASGRMEGRTMRLEGVLQYGVASRQYFLTTAYRDASPEKELPSPFFPVLPGAPTPQPSVAVAFSPALDVPDDLRDSLAPRQEASANWSNMGSSLLLTDREGRLINELGIGSWDRQGPDGRPARHEARGGVSANGGFAWYWQKVEGKTALVVLGPAGQLMWRVDQSDLCGNLEPMLLSWDAKSSLVMERDGAGCSVSAYSADGKRLMRVGDAQRVESWSLSGDGRYAAIRWGRYDEPQVLSFLDLAGRRRRDFPATAALLGKVDIQKGGVFLSAGRTLYRFE